MTVNVKGLELHALHVGCVTDSNGSMRGSACSGYVKRYRDKAEELRLSLAARRNYYLE
jgi:hypothetical protein